MFDSNGSDPGWKMRHILKFPIRVLLLLLAVASAAGCSIPERPLVVTVSNPSAT